MTIRTFKAWSAVDTLIYGSGAVASLVGAAVMSWKLRASGAGTAETYSTAVIPATWLLITIVRYVTRENRVESTAFVTPQGVNVIPGTMAWVADHQADITAVVAEVIAFWGPRYGKQAAIEDFVNGGTLVATPGPVQDPRRGEEHTGGLTDGKDTWVNADRPVAAFLWDFAHEMGHVCMNGAGEQRDHHVVMREAGWKYAL